jgi:hypothetical protein
MVVNGFLKGTIITFQHIRIDAEDAKSLKTVGNKISFSCQTRACFKETDITTSFNIPRAENRFAALKVGLDRGREKRTVENQRPNVHRADGPRRGQSKKPLELL